MVAVFAGMASGDLVTFQQVGFGLAIAVILDATIIRMVLVPASMELLGDWNWYFPAWLEWLPRINIEGARQPAVAGFVAADVDSMPAPASESRPEPRSSGLSVWRLLRRISLALFAVVVVAAALGGTTLGLAVAAVPASARPAAVRSSSAAPTPRSSAGSGTLQRGARIVARRHP